MNEERQLDRFLIQSIKPEKVERFNQSGPPKALWYRPMEAGYTTVLGEAGLYSAFETEKLLRNDHDGFLIAHRFSDVLAQLTVGAGVAKKLKGMRRHDVTGLPPSPAAQGASS